MASAATKHFVWQRMTAMIQVPLVIWLALSATRLAGQDHAFFMEWISRPLNAGLLILFVLSIFFHMRLGMNEVIEDYIHADASRRLFMMINTVFCAALASVAVFSIIASTLIA